MSNRKTIDLVQVVGGLLRSDSLPLEAHIEPLGLARTFYQKKQPSHGLQLRENIRPACGSCGTSDVRPRTSRSSHQDFQFGESTALEFRLQLSSFSLSLFA